MHNSLTLPIPDDDAKAHSEKLSQLIHEKIKQANGQIPFSTFMQMALYTPGLGYYAAGTTKFGREGDFITAPELSPLFGQCLAQAIKPIINQINESIILELGAGTGKLAATLLQYCPTLTQYFILEISADLKQRQQQTLQQYCPEMLNKVVWLDQLSHHAFRGVIIANEVMDALPATRFCWKNQQVWEYFVRYSNQQFTWHLDRPHDEMITHFVNQLTLPHQYSSEIHLLLKPWIHSLSDCLKEGVILLIDYGFPRHEFYHPDRQDGTLMCHYRHFAHPDPFWWPGLQDITAHIDFTAVAEAATQAQLQVAGFTTQAAFLLDCGILDLAENIQDNTYIKILTLPTEMGELFKVMALTRHWDKPIKGFLLQDQRFRL